MWHCGGGGGGARPGGSGGTGGGHPTEGSGYAGGGAGRASVPNYDAVASLHASMHQVVVEVEELVDQMLLTQVELI